MCLPAAWYKLVFIFFFSFSHFPPFSLCLLRCSTHFTKKIPFLTVTKRFFYVTTNNNQQTNKRDKKLKRTTTQVTIFSTNNNNNFHLTSVATITKEHLHHLRPIPLPTPTPPPKTSTTIAIITINNTIVPVILHKILCGLTLILSRIPLLHLATPQQTPSPFSSTKQSIPFSKTVGR